MAHKGQGWLRPAASDPAELRLWRRAVAVGVTVALLALTHVWVRVRVQDISRQLQTTESVLHALDIEHQELVDQEARRSSPDKIAGLARTYLGLGRARPGQVVPLELRTERDATKP